MYDTDVLLTIALPAWTATSDAVHDFPIHSQGRWLLEDVLWKVTTTFAGATSTPGFIAGISTDTDRVLEMQQLGLLASGTNLHYSLRGLYPAKFIDKTPLANGDTLRFTQVAATGGGAAGVALTWLVLRKCGRLNNGL